MKVIAKDVYGNDHEVDSSDMIWRVHVYGIVIDDGKILLSPQHGDGYDLPGGKVEMEELMEDGLVREVKEETGIDVRVKKLLGAKDIFFKVTFREPQEVWHSVMLYYLCEKIGGSISDSGFDEHEKSYAKDAIWMGVQDLSAIHIASSVDYREFARKAMS